MSLFDAENRDQFEMRVFCTAKYFTVAYPIPNQHRWKVDEYKDFAAACLASDRIPRSIVYAVEKTYSLSVPLIRARWAEYLAAWRIRLGLR